VESLEYYVSLVREMCAATNASIEATAERVRFIEILWHHAEYGWVNPELLTRAANLICNPGNWDDWKKRGGDTV
jgi:hypothetical protein